ncbi:uncharacterized protein TM35_000181680 [Trypanosoma theileri]|uniref:Uncharacterized protein n=1 Tax=Trypanosoma theileri TaxID=67003 RepID=A0A1X0NU25_9TRYP|nr:uncharacterized protein TM35_000181680 [Trypanosoma theileri]ORC88111.1 hypothetical protein TM35_000181680 [Trypanosoma theileri]
MGSQGMPTAPPSIDNVSYQSVTRSNAQPISMETSTRSSRIFFNNSISENSRNKNENDSISHQDSKGFSWNPYKRLQVDTVVESTESSHQRPKEALPSATSSSLLCCCCCCSHCQAHSPVMALPWRGCVNGTSGVESASTFNFTGHRSRAVAQRRSAFCVHPPPVAQVWVNGGTISEDSSSGSTPKSLMLEEMLRDFRERLRYPRPLPHCL